MRGVKPELISLRWRMWAWPSRLVSMGPAPSKPSPGPCEDKKPLASRLTAWISAKRDRTQKPWPPVASKPGVSGWRQTGASSRSWLKTSCGKPLR